MVVIPSELLIADLEYYRKYYNQNMKQFIEDAFGHIITSGSVFGYYQKYGVQTNLVNIHKFNVMEFLHEENDEKEFYRKLEIILSFDVKEEYAAIKPLLIDEIKKVIKTSGLNVAMRQSKKGVFFYPKGEKKLDDELVNKTLSFLDASSDQHFKEALRYYEDNKPVKSAESLRRCLEEFSRYKFGKDKVLQNILQDLKKHNPPEIQKIISTTFNYLDKYFNEYSKHRDGNIKEHENEFLIYQTGLLLRYINSVELKKSE